jgi:hypothetical protein
MESMMKTRLLGGASALVLTFAVAGSALAQNTANTNTNAAIAQTGSDSISGTNLAVDKGANTLGNNALGRDANNNAVAAQTSAAVRINAGSIEGLAVDGSDAVEQGALLKGNGVAAGNNADDQAIVGRNGFAAHANQAVADEGSALHYGDDNTSATAAQDSAAANGGSVAVNAVDDGLDSGSSLVNGNNNNTASADDGAGAVGRDGTAVGVTDNTVGGPDATVAFGQRNTVASAHLDATVAGLAVGVAAGKTTITTGNIAGNSTSSMTGANRVAFNTGAANQTRALAIAADTSFQQ